jgi:Flp pilus assembly pilin Flp
MKRVYSRNIVGEESGQTLSEYVLLALVCIAALIGVFTYLNDSVRDYMMRVLCVLHLPFP